MSDSVAVTIFPLSAPFSRSVFEGLELNFLLFLFSLVGAEFI